MAHFKCMPCKARVWRDGVAADHAGDLCPACAWPLEPVDRAEELVGFRALRVRPLGDPLLADHVRQAIARHDRALAISAMRDAGDDRA